MIGMFAKSLAGHDKDEIYLIIEETASSYTLADGRLKKISAAKRKNKKHVQLIKKTNEMSELIKEKMKSGQDVSNEEIKRAIKLLKMRKMEE